jgi:DNA-binding Lrp family transcriptional regulator
MDQLDEKIIHELQHGFELETNPYHIIAQKLGISVDKLLERVKNLKESGVIRRVGVSIDSRKIGYASTLAAVRIGPENFDKASDFIAKYPETTHSYQRANEFNIWFTLIASSKERIAEILEEIRIALELNENDVLNLPTEKLFKLDARFKPK